MSAADLRRAAEVLRERAEAAGPDFDRGVAKLGRRTRKGQYAQTMHPGVGLALADWLDATGERIAARGVTARWTEPERHALTVARLILGDDA